MNKKVAIATFVANNYGTCLQAYALKRAVEQLGYNPEVITAKNRGHGSQKKPGKLSSFFRIMRQYGPLKFFRFLKARKYWCLNDKMFREFFQEYLDWDSLSTTINDSYDLAITGSDMVWSSEYIEHADFYFLRWIEPAKRVAYAPSFGSVSVCCEVEKMYAQYLKDFKAISCREKGGCDYIKRISNINASFVCDPTLLFTSEDWHKFLNFDSKASSILLVNCFGGLGRADRLSLKRLAHMKGWNIRYLNIGIDETLNEAKYDYQGYGPSQFLSLSSRSDFQIVNGYHGLIFAIIFNKPFVALHRYQDEHWAKHEQRMVDLLDYLGIPDRYIFSLSEIKDYHFELDYSEINQKLEKFRKDSWAYLANALK